MMVHFEVRHIIGVSVTATLASKTKMAEMV